MKALTSRDNPQIKQLHALATSGRERRKSGRTLLDGAHLVEVALDAGHPIETLVVSERGLASAEIVGLLKRVANVQTLYLPDALFAHVSPVDSPSGLLAVVAPPAPVRATLDASLVVLDGVQDAGNLGTILRTAAAAGIRTALLTEGCAQAWAPRVLRAGMGAHFALMIEEHVEAAERLQGFDGQILATGLGPQARDLYAFDLRGPVAWLFGAEGQGVSPDVAALATAQVTIPMPGAGESLNVGAAAAVCLFEQVRQQLRG